MSNRPLAWCVYAFAVAAVLSPLLGLVLQIWPLEAGSVQWRFGAGGLYPTSLMIPAIGLAGLFWAGLRLEHQMTITLFTTISAIIVVLTVPLVGMFLLDAQQLRGGIDAAGRAVFDQSALGSLLNYGLMIVVYATYAFQGFRTLKTAPKTRSKVIAAGFKDGR